MIVTVKKLLTLSSLAEKKLVHPWLYLPCFNDFLLSINAVSLYSSTRFTVGSLPPVTSTVDVSWIKIEQDSLKIVKQFKNILILLFT